MNWLHDALWSYERHHSGAIEYMTCRACVNVESRPRRTQPQPDLAVYSDFALHVPNRNKCWEDVSPVLVVEVVSADDPDKDLVRNVELYEQVPSIREYWILDPRVSADRPTLLVHRRRGARWQRVITVAPGGVYTTRLLPDFSLVVDPHR